MLVASSAGIVVVFDVVSTVSDRILSALKENYLVIIESLLAVIIRGRSTAFLSNFSTVHYSTLSATMRAQWYYALPVLPRAFCVDYYKQCPYTTLKSFRISSTVKESRAYTPSSVETMAHTLLSPSA